ncbi:MAG: glycosidase [Lentisphaerae bacterium]|nr:glycosidase [Lentisphaerota bacterium]
MVKYWEYSSPLKRYAGNPILRGKDLPYPANSVFNAAVTRYAGRYVVVFRTEMYHGRSCLGQAWSKDGIHWEPEPQPILWPADREPWASRECRGIWDPRLTQIDDTYYLCYVAEGELGSAVAIASTQDFKGFERLSYPFYPVNRNACLLPEKWHGEFFMYHRPSGMGRDGIWSATSPDLELWHNHRLCLLPRSYTWDDVKAGTGAVPIKTAAGWLMIYHGVRQQAAGPIYRIGAALFDLDDPARLIGRSRQWLLQPEEPYEFQGNVGNVVFPCAALLAADGQVKIYYGAADQSLCLATCSLDELLATVRPVGEDDPELRGM